MTPQPRQRYTIIGASLGALFLGALDALIISAAMPTVTAELGGVHLYSWVYSAYFLSRAVSLPIVGKLADRYSSKSLLMVMVGTFLSASVAAGCAWNMQSLIVGRVVQGIGAGGIFALVYIVLADVSTLENRGRTLSLASFTWGIASVLGPTLGGFIASSFSWRWVFLINLPLGLACIWGISAHVTESSRSKRTAALDWRGAVTLSVAMLAFLYMIMSGGRSYPWRSPQVIGLLLLSMAALAAFIKTELTAEDPILHIGFFANRSFSTGNGAIFLSSFAIFSLFAFAPLFIQGAQGRSPMQVGIAMLSLSLGWSLGSLTLGQFIDGAGRKACAIAGAICLITGCTMTLAFTGQSGVGYMFVTFLMVGAGMGFVSLSTLIEVQSGLGVENLGVATSSNQLARTLGGTVGVGFCGAIVAGRFSTLSSILEKSGLTRRVPDQMSENGMGEIGRLFTSEVQAALPQGIRQMVRDTVADGVQDVFIAVIVSAVLCLLLCLLMPASRS